jgi:hypothetical protein
VEGRGTPLPFHFASSLHFHLRLCSAPPPPRSTIVAFCHCPSSGEVAPRRPLHLPLTMSMSRWLHRWQEHCFPAAFSSAWVHRRPAPSDVLQSVRQAHEHRTTTVSITDLSFGAGYLLSEPPPSSSLSPSTSPPLDLYGDRPTIQPPPVGSLWTRLPPRLHLIRRVTTGQLESVGEPPRADGD